VQFAGGVMVGCFAPVEEQAQTLFARIVQRLTSERAQEIMAEPDIDDEPDGGGKLLTLKNSGSFVRLQTAHERANIESKTYHIIVIDEAQRADERVVRKSIHPMGASTNATIIKTGTPTSSRATSTRRSSTTSAPPSAVAGKQNHFEANWREVIKYNPRYKKFIAKEMRASARRATSSSCRTT
jgi:phage terminase large subunit-like protein